MRNQNIEEAEVVEKTKKTKGKSYEEEFSETILASLEYLKRNSYIKSLWNQRNDRKISNLLKTEDEAFVVDLLSRFGRSYHENIKASIILFFIKNISQIISIFFFIVFRLILQNITKFN